MHCHTLSPHDTCCHVSSMCTDENAVSGVHFHRASKTRLDRVDRIQWNVLKNKKNSKRNVQRVRLLYEPHIEPNCVLLRTSPGAATQQIEEDNEGSARGRGTVSRVPTLQAFGTPRHAPAPCVLRRPLSRVSERATSDKRHRGSSGGSHIQNPHPVVAAASTGFASNCLAPSRGTATELLLTRARMCVCAAQSSRLSWQTGAATRYTRVRESDSNGRARRAQYSSLAVARWASTARPCGQVAHTPDGWSASSRPATAAATAAATTTKYAAQAGCRGHGQLGQETWRPQDCAAKKIKAGCCKEPFETCD